jgi:hypothetical protein
MSLSICSKVSELCKIDQYLASIFDGSYRSKQAF